MNKHDTSGPAFPVGPAFPGMTLRDYFAAKAMPLAMRRLQYNYQASSDVGNWFWDDDDWDAIAEHSYAIADAMLRARQHPTTTE